jgi:hypothetical protein
MNDDAPAGQTARAGRRDRRRGSTAREPLRLPVRSPGRVEGARARHRGNLTHRGEGEGVSGGDGHAGCDGDSHGEVLRRRDVRGGSDAPGARRRGGSGCRSGSWQGYSRQAPDGSIALARVLRFGRSPDEYGQPHVVLDAAAWFCAQRVGRAVGSKNRRSCPRPNPTRHHTTRFQRVTTLRLRLRPGLDRLIVRAQLEGGRLSPPLRRFLRVVG